MTTLSIPEEEPVEEEAREETATPQEAGVERSAEECQQKREGGEPVAEKEAEAVEKVAEKDVIVEENSPEHADEVGVEMKLLEKEDIVVTHDLVDKTPDPSSTGSFNEIDVKKESSVDAEELTADYYTVVESSEFDMIGYEEK